MNRYFRRNKMNPNLPTDVVSTERIPDRTIGKKNKSKGFKKGRNGRKMLQK